MEQRTDHQLLLENFWVNQERSRHSQSEPSWTGILSRERVCVKSMPNNWTCRKRNNVGRWTRWTIWNERVHTGWNCPIFGVIVTRTNTKRNISSTWQTNNGRTQLQPIILHLPQHKNLQNLASVYGSSLSFLLVFLSSSISSFQLISNSWYAV